MNKRLLAIGLTAVLALAGCGGATDSATDSPDTSARVGPAETGRGGPGVPEGSGEVVQVSDTTAQVQNQVGQVAVTWTETTTFTQQVKTDLSAVAVGACAAVTSDDTTSAEVVATAVRLSKADDDGCVGAARRGPAGDDDQRRDTDRTPPSDLPDGAIERGPGAGPGRGSVGEVVSVSATGFTVSVQDADEGSTATVDVTVSPDTAVTTTADASASDVKVGRCITSDGSADETGAITAQTIAVSDPVDGGCSAGFRGQRRQAAG